MLIETTLAVWNSFLGLSSKPKKEKALQDKGFRRFL